MEPPRRVALGGSVRGAAKRPSFSVGGAFETGSKLDLAALTAELEGVDDAFFQPEASFRPLMHVVAVLADDIRDVNNAQTFDDQSVGSSSGGGGDSSSSASAAASASETVHRRGRSSTLRLVPAEAEHLATSATAWLSVRTLAGKILPVPGIGPSDTVGALMQSLTQLYGVNFPSPSSSTDTADPSPAATSSSSSPPPPPSSGAAAFGKKVPSLDRPMPSTKGSSDSNNPAKPAVVRSGCAGLYCEGVALVDQPHLVLKSVLPPGNLPPHPCTTLMLQNGSYEDLHRQKEVVEHVVDAFLNSHYGALSASVKSVKDVSAQFYGLQEQAASLRTRVDASRQLLTAPRSEVPVRSLFEKKLEHAHSLSLLEQLRQVRDAPRTLDQLLEARCFVGAVAHFNFSKELMYAEELVPVVALGPVRDAIQSKKGKLLDMIADGLLAVLFDPTTTTSTTDDDASSANVDGAATFNESSSSSSSPLVQALGVNYTLAQVVEFERSIHSSNSESNGEDNNAGGSGGVGGEGAGAVLTSHAALTPGEITASATSSGPRVTPALQLQLLLTAAAAMGSLSDVISYVMERSREGLRSVELACRARASRKNSGRAAAGGNGGGGDGANAAASDSSLDRGESSSSSSSSPLSSLARAAAAASVLSSGSAQTGAQRAGRTGGGGGDRDNDRGGGGETKKRSALVMFLEDLLATCIGVVRKHLHLCRLVHAVETHITGEVQNNDVSWTPAKRLWSTMQAHLQDVLAQSFTDTTTTPVGAAANATAASAIADSVGSPDNANSSGAVGALGMNTDALKSAMHAAASSQATHALAAARAARAAGGKAGQSFLAASRAGKLAARERMRRANLLARGDGKDKGDGLSALFFATSENLGEVTFSIAAPPDALSPSMNSPNPLSSTTATTAVSPKSNSNNGGSNQGEFSFGGLAHEPPMSNGGSNSGNSGNNNSSRSSGSGPEAGSPLLQLPSSEMATSSTSNDSDLTLQVEPDPVHAIAAFQPVQRFCSLARQGMAHFLPPLGAAKGSGEPLDLEEWLNGYLATTVLPLLREDATDALDAILQDQDALKPSLTFAAQAALDYQAQQRARRVSSSAAAAAAAAAAAVATSGGGGGSGHSVSMSLSESGQSQLPPLPLLLPPPVTCVEAAEEVLGSLIAQVGVLPQHRSKLVDLCEEAAVGLLVALKEEGLRLSGSAEAAERLSSGGHSLEAAIRRDPSYGALTRFYEHAVTLSSNQAQVGSSSSDAGDGRTRDGSSEQGESAHPSSAACYEGSLPVMQDLWWSEVGNEYDESASSSSSGGGSGGSGVRSARAPPAGVLPFDCLLADRRSVGALFSLAHSAAWLHRRLLLHAQLLLPAPAPLPSSQQQPSKGAQRSVEEEHEGATSSSKSSTPSSKSPVTPGGTNTMAVIDDARRRKKKVAGSGGFSFSFGAAVLTASSADYRRLQAVAAHFSQLADSLYMVLRLDAVLACFCFMHRLPNSFERALHAKASQAAAATAAAEATATSSAAVGAGAAAGGAPPLSPRNNGGLASAVVNSPSSPRSRGNVVGTSAGGMRAATDGSVTGLQKHLAHLLSASSTVAPPLARAFVLSPVAGLAPNLAIACVAHAFPRPALYANSSFSSSPSSSSSVSSSATSRQRNRAFNLPPPSPSNISSFSVSGGSGGVHSDASPEFTLLGIEHLVFGVAISLQRNWATLTNGPPPDVLDNLPPLTQQLLLLGEGSSFTTASGSVSSSVGIDMSGSGSAINSNSSSSSVNASAPGAVASNECGRAADFFALLAADEAAFRSAMAGDRKKANHGNEFAVAAAGREGNSNSSSSGMRFTQAEWRALWTHAGPNRRAATAATFEEAWNKAAPS